MKKIMLLLVLTTVVSSCKVVSYSRDDNMAKKIKNLAYHYDKDRRPAKYSQYAEEHKKGELPPGKPNRVRNSFQGVLSMLVGLKKAKEMLKDIPVVNEEEKDGGGK